MVYFYCCLLNIIANAIIKATFMIVTTTIPKNSSFIVLNNAISTISTTSNFSLAVLLWICKKVATHSAYFHFLCELVYTISFIKLGEHDDYL